MYVRYFAPLALAAAMFTGSAAMLTGSAAIAADEVGARRSNTRTQSDRNRYHNTSKSSTYARRSSRAAESGSGGAAMSGAGMAGAAPQLRGLQIAPAGVALLGNNAAATGGNATVPGSTNIGMGIGGYTGMNAARLSTGYGVGVPGTFTYLPGIGYAPGYPTVSVVGGTAGGAGTGAEAGFAGGTAGAPGVAPVAGALAGPGLGGATVASPPGGSFAPSAVGYRVLPEATPGPVRQAMVNNPNWPARHRSYMRSIPLEPGESAGAPMHTAAASPSVINTPPAATGASPLSARAMAYQRMAPSEPTIIDNSLRGAADGWFARDASGRYGHTAAGITGTPIAPPQPAPRPAITRDVAPR